MKLREPISIIVVALLACILAVNVVSVTQGPKQDDEMPANPPECEGCTK